MFFHPSLAATRLIHSALHSTDSFFMHSSVKLRYYCSEERERLSREKRVRQLFYVYTPIHNHRLQFFKSLDDDAFYARSCTRGSIHMRRALYMIKNEIPWYELFFPQDANEPSLGIVFSVDFFFH